MKKKNFHKLVICFILLTFLTLTGRILKLYNDNITLSRGNILEEIKTIRGVSMFPLLKDGEKVKALINYYSFYLPKRDDLVIIQFKTQPNKFFVKKLKGLPQDKVEIKDKILFINGEEVLNSEGKPYFVEGKSENLLLKPLVNSKIPDGYYLVLSEEIHSSSFDSRYFGYLEINHLKGKVIKLNE